MDLNAKLDFNVVAVDQGETVNLLLEIAAPGLRETGGGIRPACRWCSTGVARWAVASW